VRQQKVARHNHRTHTNKKRKTINIKLQFLFVFLQYLFFLFLFCQNYFFLSYKFCGGNLNGFKIMSKNVVQLKSKNNNKKKNRVVQWFLFMVICAEERVKKELNERLSKKNKKLKKRHLCIDI